MLTDFREGLTVILAGQPGQLRLFLDTSPVLAFRFPAIIEFPGYTATELDGIFAVLGGEAGFTLTSAADRKAATVRGQVNSGRGSTRPAIRLLQRATANQARRVAAADQPAAPAALGVIDPADIPHHLALCRPGRPEGQRNGQAGGPGPCSQDRSASRAPLRSPCRSCCSSSR